MCLINDMRGLFLRVVTRKGKHDFTCLVIKIFQLQVEIGDALCERQPYSPLISHTCRIYHVAKCNKHCCIQCFGISQKRIKSFESIRSNVPTVSVLSTASSVRRLWRDECLFQSNVHTNTSLALIIHYQVSSFGSIFL